MKSIKLEATWKEKLLDEFSKDYMKSLSNFLREEQERKKILFPLGSKIFNAFSLTKFEDVKVVILGQDPYHGEGQAHGLSFSVEKGVPPPPSLENIFKELKSDLGIEKPSHGNLQSWGEQGVLLLNSILTVEKGRPGSHAGKGWETFTDTVLFKLNCLRRNIVFILWGKKAQDKGDFINTDKHFIVKSSHPSPFSANRGFLGSRPFSRANSYLKKNNIDPIDWSI